MVHIFCLCLHGKGIFSPSPNSPVLVTSDVASFHQPKLRKVSYFKLGQNSPIRMLIPELLLSIFFPEIMLPVLREDPKHIIPLVFKQNTGAQMQSLREQRVSELSVAVGEVPGRTSRN